MLVLRWGGSRWLAPWWAWNVAIPKSALQASGLKKAEHVLKRLSFQPRNTYSNGRKPWVEQAERAERTHDCMTAQPDAGQQPWAAPPAAHLSKWWSNGLPTGSAACCRVPVASCAAMAGARDHPSPNAWAFSRGGERGCGGGQKKGKQPCGLSTGSSPGSHNLFGRFQASESLCNPHDPAESSRLPRALGVRCAVEGRLLPPSAPSHSPESQALASLGVLSPFPGFLDSGYESVSKTAILGFVSLVLAAPDSDWVDPWLQGFSAEARRRQPARIH